MVIGGIINLYPVGHVFTNVVQTISLRNNIMHLVKPAKAEGELSLTDPWGIFFTLLVIIPCYIISAAITDI